MKLFLGDLVTSKSVVQKFATFEFSAKVSYRIKTLINLTKPFLDTYEESRVSLIKKFGKDEDGTISIEPNTKSWFDFVKELNDVASEKVELAIEEFDIEDLIKDESIKISAMELSVFEMFCKKPADSTEKVE